MIDRLEKKLGKYAIPNLMLYIIGGYFIGYMLVFGSTYTNISYTSFITLEPYLIIHKFQIWRIISWILLPPIGSTGPLTVFFAVIMMIMYHQLGSILERTWGTFKFNLYIFGGILFTVIGAFILYGIYAALGFTDATVGVIGSSFSTYYINLSIFLAFAVCYPEMKVMLYFIIPIKMKYMAILYGVISVYELFTGTIPNRIVLVASLLNFVIFFITTRSWNLYNPKDIHRRQQFKRDAQQKPRYGSENVKGFYGNSHHKCSVCGRTELTNPELEFRFCSKCNGNYEYCQDHLFTHEHVK